MKGLFYHGDANQVYKFGSNELNVLDKKPRGPLDGM